MNFTGNNSDDMGMIKSEMFFFCGLRELLLFWNFTIFVFWIFVFLFICTRGWGTLLAMQFQRSGQLVCKTYGNLTFFVFCFFFCTFVFLFLFFFFCFFFFCFSFYILFFSFNLIDRFSAFLLFVSYS